MTPSTRILVSLLVHVILLVLISLFIFTQGPLLDALQPVSNRLIAIAGVFALLSVSMIRRTLHARRDDRQPRLGGRNRKSKHSLLPLLLMSTVGASLIVFWTLGYYAQREALRVAEAEARSLRQLIDQVNPQADLRALLPLLNEARASLYWEQRVRPASLVLRFGLDIPDSIRKESGALYREILEVGLLSRMMIFTEKILRQESDLTVLFDALKSYLMLSLPERLDKEFVRRFYMYWWDKQFSATMSSEQILELGAHLDALLDEEMLLPFDLDRNLVMYVRGRLERQTISDFYYSNIMRRAFRYREGKGFTVIQAVGDDASRVLRFRTGQPLNRVIPGIFSPQGFVQIWLPFEGDAIKEQEDLFWVRGTDFAELAPSNDSVFSEDALKAELRTLYFENYASAYQNFLSDLELIPATSANMLVAQLELLTERDSMITRLTRAVADQTNLMPEESPSNQASDSLTIRNESLFNANSLVATTENLKKSLRRSFLVPDSLDRQMAALEDLAVAAHNYVRQDHGNVPYEVAIAAVKNAVNALRSTIRGGGSAFPDHLLVAVAGQVENVLMQGGVINLLQAAWQADALPSCESMMNGRFPFDRSSREDVLLPDFQLLFAPGGTLDTFFRKYMADYINTDGPVWRMAQSAPEGLQFSAATMRFFQRVAEIRNAYFDGSDTPRLELTWRPVGLAKTAIGSELRLGSQFLTYAHGPTRNLTVTWPFASFGDEGGDEASLSVQSTESMLSFEENGPWALHRLLDRADMLQGGQSGMWRIKFGQENLFVEYELNTGQSFRANALGGLLCPSTL